MCVPPLGHYMNIFSHYLQHLKGTNQMNPNHQVCWITFTVLSFGVLLFKTWSDWKMQKNEFVSFKICATLNPLEILQKWNHIWEVRTIAAQSLSSWVPSTHITEKKSKVLLQCKLNQRKWRRGQKTAWRTCGARQAVAKMMWWMRLFFCFLQLRDNFWYLIMWRMTLNPFQAHFSINSWQIKSGNWTQCSLESLTLQKVIHFNMISNLCNNKNSRGNRKMCPDETKEGD